MYRKLKAGKIFTGYDFLPPDSVLITGGAGEIIDLVPTAEAGEGIEIMQGILCPGFINCHCHLELSHLKGQIPKHTGLIDFVWKIVTERHFEENEILSAIAKADNEMYQNGIVAVGDICNNALTIQQKKQSQLWYHNFIEVSGFPPAVADIRFQKAREILQSFQHLTTANSIVPHAPYSVSPALFRLINDAPENHLLSMHNQECADENLFFKNKTGDFLRMFKQMNIDISFFESSGKTSLQTCLPFMQNVRSLLLVHDVYTDMDDISFAKAFMDSLTADLFFCVCPNANLYINDILPDIHKLIGQEVNIVIGTDSLASNDQLSVLEELKTIRKHFPSVPLASLLQWATQNGAWALQCDQQYGSFTKGKKPGVLLIDADGEDDFLDAKVRRLF